MSFLPGATCRGMDPDLFILPEGIKGSSAEGRRRIRLAKQACAICPTQAACREYALADASLAGVWGGMTDEERDRLRRQRRPAGAPLRGPLPGSPRKPIAHGSAGGYEAHRRRGEKACQACVDAHAEAVRARARVSRARKRDRSEFAAVWLSIDTSFVRVRRAEVYAESLRERELARQAHRPSEGSAA